MIPTAQNRSATMPRSRTSFDRLWLRSNRPLKEVRPCRFTMITHLVSKGLDDSVFDAFLGHFEDVLKELGVPAAKIAEVMPIFHGARSDVLNR